MVIEHTMTEKYTLNGDPITGTLVNLEGITQYLVDGELYREDGGPVEIDAEGTKYWIKDGKFHRVGGPAVIDTDGNEEWYLNDELHREDGPAIDFNSRKEWYLNGQLHRTDGPAMIRPNKDHGWFLHNQKYDDINEWGRAAGIFETEEFVRIKLEYGA